MTKTTNANTAEILARKVYFTLKSHGIEFQQLFPYNRFSAESSTWWACESGRIPAYSRVKLAVTEYADGRGFFVGVGIEKGYETSGIGKFNEQMTADWDWHRLVPRIRSSQFQVIEQQCADWHACVGSPMLFPECARYREQVVASHDEMIAILDRLDQHPKRLMTWCDLYVGFYVSTVQAGGNEDDWIASALIPLVQWFWPGLQQDEEQAAL